MADYQDDTPLSITSSIAGILTLLGAIAATLYVRFTYLRNADTEYFQVKASLSWYKTESTFMRDLLTATIKNDHDSSKSENGASNAREKEMYEFVVEDLARLEERLLEVVEEAEMGASKGNGGVGPYSGIAVSGEKGGWDEKGIAKKKEGWTVIPRGVRGKTDIAINWLPVRAKALELVRQRDALGSRVLFAQMSMISSRVRDQEARLREREEVQRDRLEQLEILVTDQKVKIDRIEDLLFRAVHQDEASFEAH